MCDFSLAPQVDDAAGHSHHYPIANWLTGDYSLSPVGLRRVPSGYIDGMSAIDITRLNPDERLELIEGLWASPSARPGSLPLTGAQRAELDRCLDELDRDGPVGMSWEEVYSRIRSCAT